MIKEKDKIDVGIYDISTHHHIHIYYLIKILKLISNIKIHLFISKNIYENIFVIEENIYNDIYVNLYDENNSLFLFNYKVSKLSKKLKIIILNSLLGGRKRYFSYFFLRPKCKIILIDASNGKPYIDKVDSYKGGFISKYLSYKISLWHLEKADKLIYHSREVIKIVSKYSNKPKLFLPFTLYDNSIENNTINKSREKIIFTITGGIEKKRKDYDIIFDALENLLKLKPELKNRFQIYFLGTVKNHKNKYGFSIIQKAREFNNKFGNIIKYYEEYFIDEIVYRKILKKTDVLSNNINLDYYRNGKDSSGVGESIIYSIPGIYPRGYKLYNELHSSSIFYDNEKSLAKTIEFLVSNKNELKKLKHNAINNSKKFSIEKYRKELSQFLIN